jgi:hypothetical protein
LRAERFSNMVVEVEAPEREVARISQAVVTVLA